MKRWTLLVAALSIACAAPAAARSKVVVLVGDSIFWGAGAGRGTRTVAFQLQRELKGFFIFNYSAPGATMAGLYAPTAHYVAYMRGGSGAKTLAVIGLGVNDWSLNVPIDYFSQKYEGFLIDLQAKIPRVACVGPLWSDRDDKNNKLGHTIQDYRVAIRAICHKPERDRFYWEGLTALPGDPRYFVDGLHPNRRGHRRYAKWLTKRIRETVAVPSPRDTAATAKPE